MKNIFGDGRYRSLIWAGLAVLLAAGCAGVEKREAASQLAVARTSIADAVSAGATDFAPVELKAAQDNFSAAEKAAAANDHAAARRLGERAQIDAQLATAKTRAGKAKKAEGALQESNETLREELNRKVQ